MITDREREVLRFIKDGYENHEIALRICISAHTVKAHLGSIMRKMNARNRTHLVYLALQQGLIE